MRKSAAILLFSVVLFSAMVRAADKMRLGDIHDENGKRLYPDDKPGAVTPETASPEERAAIVGQLAQESYQKGLRAMKQGRLDDARTHFERTLALTPNNAGAKQHLAAVNRALAERSPRPSRRPRHTISNTTAEKRPKPTPEPVKEQPASAEDQQQAEALYLRALSASQNGKYKEAYDLCGEALKLDPENLQARRMHERLESRVHNQ